PDSAMSQRKAPFAVARRACFDLEELRILRSGGPWIGRAKKDVGERDRPVRMVEKMRLPQHVAAQVLDVQQARLGIGRRIEVHVAKCRTPHFLAARAEGGIALEVAGALDRYSSPPQLGVRRIGRLDAESDDVRAFVAFDEGLDVAVDGRIGESHHLEIPFAEHRAVIARSERNDRSAGSGRAAVDAARSEPEAEPLECRAAALQILDGDADVVEPDRDAHGYRLRMRNGWTRKAPPALHVVPR